MNTTVRFRKMDEIPGGLRTLRQTARWTQVITGGVVLLHLAMILLTDHSPTQVQWVRMVDYVALVWAFTALTAGLRAEKRRSAREVSETSA